MIFTVELFDTKSILCIFMKCDIHSLTLSSRQFSYTLEQTIISSLSKMRNERIGNICISVYPYHLHCPIQIGIVESKYNIFYLNLKKRTSIYVSRTTQSQFSIVIRHRVIFIFFWSNTGHIQQEKISSICGCLMTTTRNKICLNTEYVQKCANTSKWWWEKCIWQEHQTC